MKQTVKWISIPVTFLGLFVYSFLFIRDYVNALTAYGYFMFSPPFIFLAVYFLSSFLLKKKDDEKVRRTMLRLSFFVMLTATLFLIILIFFLQKGVIWSEFRSMDGDSLGAGRWVYAKSLDLTAILIVIFSWSSTLMYLKISRPKYSIIPFAFVAVLIALTFFAGYMHVPHDYDG